MLNNSNKKPYRSEDLKKVLKITKGYISPKLDDKLSIAVNFIEKFQTIENTFSFIIDFVTMEYLFMSESIFHVTGHQKWKEKGVEFAMSLYHPEDEQMAKKIHVKQTDHMLSVPKEDRGKYKYTHDFRIRHADGHYIRVNHHAIFLHFDDGGNPLSSLCICNDITELKKNTTLNFEISKLNMQGGFNVILKEYYPLLNNLDITSREYEVLSHLANGSSSKEIAEELFISEHTVRDHRKNMLKKNNAKTVGELISLAHQNDLF